MNEYKTICEYCGRRYGHTKQCPIYLRQFIGGIPPNVYAMSDGTPIDELERKPEN